MARSSRARWPRIEPEGTITRMWEAIETYMEAKQPLIIQSPVRITGQGSSTRLAAKGVRLAGVKRFAGRRPSSAFTAPTCWVWGVPALEFLPGHHAQETTGELMAPKPSTFQATSHRAALLTLVINRPVTAKRV